MKLNHIFSFIFFFLFQNICLFSQNNLIILSEAAEPFQAEYQNKIFPPAPQTDVKITKITDNYAALKIVFINKNIKNIDTTLYLYHLSKPIQNQDIIYVISKNNKTIRYLATLPSSDIQPVIPEIDTSIVLKTKEEKSVQKIIFLNDSNAACLDVIDTSDFNKAIKYINQNPNIDRKITLIEQFIKHNCFNQSEAQIIFEQIPFEVERLKIIKQILPRVNNVFDLWHWKDHLKNNIAQQSFSEYYQNYLKNLYLQPLLNDSLLQTTIQQLRQTDNDFSKLNQIKILLSHYSVSLQSLQILSDLLKHDQHKEELLKCAFWSMKNKTDFEKTFQLLQFKETKERLKLFYEKYK